MSNVSTTLAVSLIDSVRAYVDKARTVVIDGHQLDIASIVAVSRHGVIPSLGRDAGVKEKVAAATEVVQLSLKDGGSLYGVTTGVGASAFTRTRQVDTLQRALVTKNLNGVLPLPSKMAAGTVQDRAHLILDEDFMHGTVMVRLNTLIRGQSGVRWVVIESMYKLLEERVVPCAAKNNTVSASGDLGTLVYIAGTLLGLEDLFVWHGIGPERVMRPASQVLKEINLTPLTYGPKEAIAILNGTAASASSAAQVLYDAFVLLLAAQAVSVLSIEALRANLEPFEPFPHTHARPHPGQIEIAENIKRMSQGSKFCFEEYPEGDPEFLLRQDRYHIRCIPQWLGPLSESLTEAAKSVNIELNSTTDNPIINPQGTFPHNLFHAGNFMALSPAEAMDKVRHAMLGIGKILYAQHTEILNPALNRGLPPDCAAGEPNLDYGLKSSDLACSAYLSELGFISGSFLPFVNSTEHHNQSINSMALASARYARMSIDLLRQLISTHLYTVCQAVDIRELNARYLSKLEALFCSLLPSIISCPDSATFNSVKGSLFKRVRVQFGLTSSMVSKDRFQSVFSPLVTELHALVLTQEGKPSVGFVQGAETPTAWVNKLAEQARDLFLQERLAYFNEGGSAHDSLSKSGQIVYGFIRKELEIPMKKGLPGMDAHEIGTRISTIFEAISSGRMDAVFKDAVIAA